MDKFPDDIQLQACMLEIEKNQMELLRETRALFCEKIRNAIKMCHQYVDLNYPENLWGEKKVKVAVELFERFGQLRTTREFSKHTSKSKVNAKSDIYKNITSIRIEFWNKYSG
uniref:Uncharacterized protein n=1 Tax=Mimivirus LCMiAC01 TaxID=2506608 RepID=A0A481YZA2_9VIRU|nr:MAG: hypothetical protein LCMiAC01_02590 [Mimivirus LCMiAC01]